MRNLSLVFLLIIYISSCTVDTAPSLDKEYYHKKSEMFKLLKNKREIDTLLLYLDKFKKENNSIGIIVSCELLEGKYRNTSQFLKSIETQNIGLNEAIRIKDTVAMIQAYNNIGTSFRRMGAYSNASENHFKGIELAENYSDTTDYYANMGKLMNMNGIGNIYLSIGNYNRAKYAFKYVLQDSDQSNDLNLAINYANLGDIYVKTKQYDSAFYFYQKSLHHNQLAKSQLGVGLCHTAFGEIYRLQNDNTKAKGEFTIADRILKDFDTWHWLNTRIELIDNLIDLKEYNTAFSYIEQAEKEALRIDAISHMIRINHLYYRYYKDKNNDKKALKYLEREVISKERASEKEKAGEALNFKMIYDRNKNKKEINEINQANDALKLRNNRIILSLAIFLLIVISTWSIYLSYQRKRLKKLNAKVTESEKIKISFINSVYHEIRTPLNILSGFSDILLNDDIDLTNDEKSKYKLVVAQKTKELTKIIDNLIEISNLDSTTDLLHKEKCNVVKIAEEVLNNYSFSNSKEISLDLNSTISNENHTTNRKYFATLLGILLDNALKFTDVGSITISLSRDGKNNKLIVKVSDTGIGIHEGDSEKIFDKFYKVDKFTDGAGLGLYFAKIIVSKMGGIIYVNPHYTNGTQIVVEL